MPTAPTTFIARPPTPRLQRHHPLARGLVIDLCLGDTNGTRWRNLATPNAYGVTPASLGVAGGSPVVVGGPYGPAIYCTGGASVMVPDFGNLAAGDFTVRIIHRPRTWSANDYVTLFDKGSGANTREMAIFVDRNGNVHYATIGGIDSIPSVSTAMAAGGLYDFVLTRSGTVCTSYVDGIARGTFGNDGTSATPASFSLGGNPSGSGSLYDGDYHLFQVWAGRCLSPAEILTLAGPDKFVLERPVAPRVSLRPSVAAAAAPAGADTIVRILTTARRRRSG